jgi:transposase
MYIVMDNAAIHKTPDVLRAIHEHGHTPLFLPPYSPMLNPIEECWAKIKQEVRKTPLAKSEIIADRIEEAAKKITKENCRGWVRHSQKFFAKCLGMVNL